MAIILDKKPDNKEMLSLSVSRVKCFDTCKKQYYFQYIEKLPSKDWQHLTLGKMVHEALEKFHRVLIADQSLPYNKVMTESFNSALKTFASSLSEESKTESIEILSKYIKVLSEQKKKDSLPKFLSVEKNFYIGVDDTLLINGFIDRVDMCQDGMIKVADYKTTKDKKYLQDPFQLMTYAYTLFLADPSLKKMRGSYILLRHNFQEITTEFDRDTVIETVEKKFIDYAAKIRSEKLWRPNPQFLCKFCSFLDHCPEGKQQQGIIDSTHGKIDW
jgi:putative RecB family exonuclease